MKNISIGKLRALQQCSSYRSTFTCLAIDHRQNLRKSNPVFEEDLKLSEFKLEITKNLSPLLRAKGRRAGVVGSPEARFERGGMARAGGENTSLPKGSTSSTGAQYAGVV